MTDLSKNFNSLLESAKGLSQVLRQSAGTSSNFDSSALKEILNANSLSAFNTSFVDAGIDQKALSTEEIVHKLNSTREGSKLIALKYIMKLMSTESVRDEEMLVYFPHVLKGINSPNLTIKKLVFIFLLRYNHKQPDIALLSINAIQKSLADRDPVIRSLAIRVLGGVQIKAIVPILMLSLKKTIVDVSALVRASSAIAIRKCYALEGSNPYQAEDDEWIMEKEDNDSITAQLYTFLSQLLADSDPMVIGTALVTFHELFPHGYKLLHKVFRHICSNLRALEPVAQSLAIQLLTIYCRKFLQKPHLVLAANEKIYFDCYPHKCSDVDSSSDVLYDPDLLLFLDAQENLIHSLDSNVLFSVAKSFLCLSCATTIKKYKINVMLLNMLSLVEPSRLKPYVLQLILLFTMYEPSLFSPHIKEFFVFPSDDSQTIRLKVAILVQLLNADTFGLIFNELKYYLHESSYVEDESKVEILKLVNELYSNPKLLESQVSTILNWYLSKLDQCIPPSLLTEYFNGIRLFIQEDLISNERTLGILVAKLVEHKVEGPTKGSIIWLLGEFANLSDLHLNASFMVDILRVMLHNFPSESPEVKLNILYLAAKLLAKDIYNLESSNKNNSDFNFNSPLFKCFNLVLNYCKYDKSVDIRDRARLISSLLPNVVVHEENSVNIMNLERLIETQHISLARKLRRIEIGVLVFQVFKKPPKISTKKCEKLISKLIRDYLEIIEWNTLSATELVRFSEKRNFDLDIKNYSQNTSWLSNEYNKCSTNVPALASHNPLVVGSSQPQFSHPNNLQSSKSLKIKTLDEFFSSDSVEEYSTSSYNENSEQEDDDQDDDADDDDDQDENDDADDDVEEEEDDGDEGDVIGVSRKDGKSRNTNYSEIGDTRGKWT
ncbi:BA75_02309T0 [Komagataella pastoris]|uniref:BA75_02309T0 n=1 Tax=Komagataella pastoris TaxID=4922 RepID=A0A1B2JD02_PICPA|nr:BA75_02309T0 [Komagataella pastoris]